MELMIRFQEVQAFVFVAWHGHRLGPSVFRGPLVIDCDVSMSGIYRIPGFRRCGFVLGAIDCLPVELHLFGRQGCRDGFDKY